MKKLLFTQRSDTPHWVGDGFPVRSIFSYREHAEELSPFLLLDYAGPMEFAPSGKIRGVGEHPHRGFETVTIVYSGEVAHRDSSGGGGKIIPGDVQWMTAASGLVHEEFHSEEFTKRGGLLEMVQLWVNLPAKFKMTEPRYQGIEKKDIPEIDLPNNAGNVRVIAGEFTGTGTQGPAKTFSPVNLWDVRLNAEYSAEFRMPTGHTCLVFVLSGKVKLNSGEVLSDAELGVLERSGELFTLTAQSDAKILLLGGAPLNEPVVGYGPFVMNTKQEVMQAYSDFENGKMGHIGMIEGSR
jgi:redox-sensitive bicupin YhaK (pirin superfamily)